MNVSDADLKEGTNKIFTMVDQDGNGKVTKKELLSTLFKIIDEDQNQHLSKKDLIRMVKAYAKFLNITLKPEWKKSVKEWYSSVDKGVTQEELMAFLAHHGESIHSLEGAVRSLDKNFKHNDQDGHDHDDSHNDEDGHDHDSHDDKDGKDDDKDGKDDNTHNDDDGHDHDSQDDDGDDKSHNDEGDD
jgi:Ca2+-binding EF-hand superfamily protein